MEVSSFFNSVNKDRGYKAEHFARFFSSFIGTGVYANKENSLAVLASENMSVVVKSGRAFINGYYYENDSDLQLNFDTADGVLNRIDRIVVRWSLANRAINIAILKGTPGSAPTAASITRNSEIFELAIADIYIQKGAVKINQNNITDLRNNNNLCGYVSHVIQDFDFNTLYTSHVQQFNALMAQVHGILDGETATHLLNLINSNTASITGLQQQFNAVKFRYVNANGDPESNTSIERYLQIYNEKDAVWEWINTPNKLGIEHRTTRIYLDKPVYACKIDVPIANNGSINHVLQDAQIIIIDHTLRFKSNDGQYHLLLPYLDPQYPIYLSLRSRGVLVHKNTGWGDGRIYGTVYYTKGVPA